MARDDNFFELGGNSLLVVRMLRELPEQGLPKVAMQDFYRNSVAGRFIELVRAGGEGADSPPGYPAGSISWFSQAQAAIATRLRTPSLD